MVCYHKALSLVPGTHILQPQYHYPHTLVDMYMYGQHNLKTIIITKQ